MVSAYFTGAAARWARSCFRSIHARSRFTIPKPSSTQVYWPCRVSCVRVSSDVTSKGRALASSTRRIVRASVASGLSGWVRL